VRKTEEMENRNSTHGELLGIKKNYRYHCQLMVAERKRVDRLGSKEPARASASPFRPTIEKEGDEKVPKK